VAAFHEWPGIAKFIYVKLHAGAVTETVSLVVTLNGFNLNATVDASHALQCLFENVCLQFALTRKFDVTELRTSSATDAGLLPDMFDAVRRGNQNLLWLCTAKGAAAIFIDQSANFFARQYVRHKDHSPIVTCDEDSAVGNFFDFELEHSA
jgi:hypothetical protein